MRFSTFALALCAALPSTHATSGEIAEQAAKAEQLLEMGSSKRDAAIEAWQNAQDAYWKKLRFQVRNVQLVNSVRGYGVYEPRADSIYKVGDTIQIYMEPVGYGFIANDQGGVSVGFSALTSIQSKSGEPMQGEFTAPVVAGVIPSHRKNYETFLFVTMKVNKAPPGQFTATIVVQDKSARKADVVEVNFEIAP